MIEGSIKKDLILTGSESIAAFKQNGAIYRVEPFPVIQEISLYALEANRTKIFKLDDRLTHDYEILGVTAEIPMTEAEMNGEVTDPGKFKNVGLAVRIYSGVKTTSEVEILLTPYPFYVNKLFINHRDTWHMKADRDVASITFMCKPIYLEQPLVFP